MTKSWALVGVLLAAVCFVGGCANKAGVTAIPLAPASSASTEALPGGGIRASVTRSGLSFTAEVSSTTVGPDQTLVAAFKLVNTGTRAVQWDRLDLGWDVWALDSRDDSPTLVESLGRYGYIASLESSPSVLAPGETATQTVSITYLRLGSYRAIPGFKGRNGPSASTPEILIQSVAH